MLPYRYPAVTHTHAYTVAGCEFDMASAAPKLTSQLTLFGSWLCPFVHRVWITVLEKKVDFTWVEIDLKNKPDWFLGVNPVGKVPVIGYQDAEGEHIINESMTLLEFF